MVTNKNDFMVTFFIIFSIFALNACATVRYKSRPALEPEPVAGPATILEAEPKWKYGVVPAPSKAPTP